MFESYDINTLYKATVVDHGSLISMDNVGGCISFMSDSEPKCYETILCVLDSGYIDIYHPKRTMNSEIGVPSKNTARTSKNGHLYTVVEDSLVRYKDTIENDSAKSLKRTIFGNIIK